MYMGTVICVCMCEWRKEFTLLRGRKDEGWAGACGQYGDKRRAVTVLLIRENVFSRVYVFFAPVSLQVEKVLLSFVLLFVHNTLSVT